MFIKKIQTELTPKDIIDSSVQSPEVQVARLEMMLEVSRAFNSTLDLNTLIQSIIEVATQLTDTETAAILLLNRKNGDFYFEMLSMGENRKQTDLITVPFEGSLAGWIVKNGEALVVDNIQAETGSERHHDGQNKDRHDGHYFGPYVGHNFSEIEQTTHFAAQTVLGVPLIVKEKIVGALEVFNKHNNTGFSGDDIHTLNILGTQAAAAIENIRFFEQRDRLDSVFNELQSPMTSIIGSSQVMLANPKIKTKDLRTGLEHINREATRLSQMVDDFLNLTKIETGRVKMNKQMVDLSVLAQEVIDLFYPQALEKKITLSLAVNRHIPDIPADADRLKQVIINLVDNAIRYNHEGGQVEITLGCNQVRIQLSVYDTGKGIAPKDLGLVFDKFYHGQDDEDVDRGAGLGLSVAKKIIEAHGGDIWVQSEMEGGSKFTFSLPLLDNGDA